MGDQPLQAINPNPMPGGAAQGLQPGQMPQGQPAPTEPAVDSEELEFNKTLLGANIAASLKKKDKRKGTNVLKELGDKVVSQYEIDESSREEWCKRNEEWMKLATQVMEKKSFPWDGAANVKYPLLSMAALQFSARAYSSLIPSLDVVKVKVVGPDQDGQLTDVANKLSTHMSYQVLYEMDGWEEDMDTLCFVLPIVGVMFKKTYYSEIQKCNVSELVHAKDFVVNYGTKSLKKCSRYTHVLYFTENEIKERQNYGLFLETDKPLGPGMGDDRSVTGDGSTTGIEPSGRDDDETPRKILEQYRWIDLDDDGYKEPYIVTVDYETHEVLRITPNFVIKDVERDDDGKILCITPCQWFTKFGFIPNPDGGFYDLGFGLLLGGINATVNTLTNQLLDSGTLQTLQAGFLAKGLKLGGKDLKFKVGEWKQVNAIGDDLRKNIMPLPVNPPSEVLFNLLGALSQAGKELASVAEIFTGKMPGQNTPAATTMATIEQGLKVFTSIYKRIYRSLTIEFSKLYELNKIYMPTEITRFVSEINGDGEEYKVSRFDYQAFNAKVVPASDPNMVSETQKLMKIQQLHELVPLGTINVQEMTRQALVIGGQENIQALTTLPPPQPPLEIQIKQMELADKEKDRQIEMMKVQSESRKRESEIVLNIAKAKQLGDEQGAMMLEAQLEREKATAEIQTKWMDLLFKREEHQMEMQHKKEDHAIDSQLKVAEGVNQVRVNKALGDQKIEQGRVLGDHKIEQSKKLGDHKIEQTKEMGKLKAQQAKEKPKSK